MKKSPVSSRAPWKLKKKKIIKIVKIPTLGRQVAFFPAIKSYNMPNGFRIIAEPLPLRLHHRPRAYRAIKNRTRFRTCFHNVFRNSIFVKISINKSADWTRNVNFPARKKKSYYRHLWFSNAACTLHTQRTNRTNLLFFVWC